MRTLEDRFYQVLKENKGNYTIDNNGRINLKREYVNQKLKMILTNLKNIKVK